MYDIVIKCTYYYTSCWFNRLVFFVADVSEPHAAAPLLPWLHIMLRPQWLFSWSNCCYCSGTYFCAFNQWHLPWSHLQWCDRICCYYHSSISHDCIKTVRDGVLAASAAPVLAVPEHAIRFIVLCFGISNFGIHPIFVCACFDQLKMQIRAFIAKST